MEDTLTSHPLIKSAPEYTESGEICVDGQVLEALVSAHPLVGQVLDYRKAVKDHKTYFVGYAALTWEDGLIHPSINHCSTDTGRTSCTKPNLQNASRKDT